VLPPARYLSEDAEEESENNEVVNPLRGDHVLPSGSPVVIEPVSSGPILFTFTGVLCDKEEGS
jgi:hypothetical protein